MDYATLNRETLNSESRGTSLFPLGSSSTGITFGVSEVQMTPFDSVTTGVTFSAYGDLGSLIGLSGPTGLTFNVAAQELFALVSLSAMAPMDGGASIAFDVTGSLINLAGMLGNTGITMNAISGELYVVISLSGNTGITLDTSGTIFAMICLFGDTGIAFSNEGEMWVNPFAEEDDDRTFRRPMTLKEFRRQ